MKIIYFISFIFFYNAAFGTVYQGFEVDAKYAIDNNSSWNFNELKHKSFTSFHNSQNLNLGYNENATVWCWFKIKNSDVKQSKKLWLCFNNNHLDSLVCYDGNKQKILGDRTPFSSPIINSQVFEISLNPSQTKFVFVKIKKIISFLDFSYSFEEEKKLIKQSEIKIVTISFFLGFISLLVFFNFILFYVSKKKLYAYYILYSLLTAIYIMISTNFAKHILFPEFLYFSEFRIYAACFWFVFLTLFITNLLAIKNTQTLKYKVIKSLNVFNLIVIVITLFLLMLKEYYPLRIFIIVVYVNFILIIIFMFWAAIAHLKVDKRMAMYVLLAFFPQFLWATGWLLNIFQIIPKSLHEDSLVFISLYEVVLFGFVLTKNYIDTFKKNQDLITEISLEKENSIKAITKVQIRERRNISNQIHDNFGSKIAHIQQLLELKKIEFAQNNIQKLASDIREISHQILPKSLDDGALCASLKNEIDNLNFGYVQSKIELFTYDFPMIIDEQWVYDLYLISLEIINNAQKHGKSNTICVELFDYSKEYLFQYTDDGIGFDSHLVSKGFGLENIEKRVLYYKGTFEINSVIDQGTVVQIIIPKK